MLYHTAAVGEQATAARPNERRDALGAKSGTTTLHAGLSFAVAFLLTVSVTVESILV
jgi:hypothetical protein